MTLSAWFLTRTANAGDAQDWLPEAGADSAATFDAFFSSQLCWTMLILVLVLLPVLLFFFRDALRKAGWSKDTSSGPGKRIVGLQKGLGVIVLASVVCVFCRGLDTRLDMVVAPAEAMAITVTGPEAPDYDCTYHYDGTDVFSNELVAPTGQPVALQFQTHDSTYTVSIPAFRVQETMGENPASSWFAANSTGAFPARCTTRTATASHASTSVARVVSPEDYKNWILTDGGKAGPGGLPPLVLGEKLYTSLGCNACHSVDGSTVIGPTFQGLYGTELRALSDGSTVTADDAYIRQSVLDPASQIAEGFQPLMPPFTGRVSDDDIANLTAFIASLAQ